MNASIVIPSAIAESLRRHLFQNDLEQGAFLFARAGQSADGLSLVVEDSYLVPTSGWEVQMEVYLQMKDSERAKIMQLARTKDLCAIDCHSHPHAEGDVWFSPSDIAGITEFADYAKWKLDGRPFAAIVCGETSVDAVVWIPDIAWPTTARDIRIEGARPQTLYPTNSWFQRPRGKHRFESYE
jgi:hypothetical protein